MLQKQLSSTTVSTLIINQHIIIISEDHVTLKKLCWIYTIASQELYSDINSIAGCPSIAIVSLLLEFKQMAFICLRVCGTLFLCTAAVEEVRARAV